MTQPAPADDPRVILAHDRTDMAAYRTELALDRTMLAWIRTTLSMASFGFGLVAFFRSIEERNPSANALRMHTGAVRVGMALIVLGIAATIGSGLVHWFALRDLRRGVAPRVRVWSLSLTVAFLFVVVSAAGLWSMFER